MEISLKIQTNEHFIDRANMEKLLSAVTEVIGCTFVSNVQTSHLEDMTFYKHLNGFTHAKYKLEVKQSKK